MTNIRIGNPGGADGVQIRALDFARVTPTNGLPIIAIIFFLFVGDCFGDSLKINDAKCEYRVNPLGIDTTHPRLSWIIESSRRGEAQTAYEILAASSESNLAGGKPDLWDSGKIISTETLGITYAGKPLRSQEKVFWKVRIWDRVGKPSAFSHTATFETALLAPTDWQANWIQSPHHSRVKEAEAYDDHPAPLLRRQFQLDKKIKSARAYVSGLGYFELRLNGERVGKDVLNPGWTSYAKRVLYSTYDVTAQLKRGQNTVGIMLGNGWFNPLPLALWGRIRPDNALVTGEPRAMLQLVVEFTDGTTQTIGTDEGWRTANGPILRNSIYLGEFYDARRERPGWDRAGFDDSNSLPTNSD